MASEKKYYVKDEQERVAGPFSRGELIKAAKAGRILPSWGISSTRTKWTPAAQLPDLFAPVDAALTTAVPQKGNYRDLTRKEQVALFVDKFVLNNEHLKDSMPWLQNVRVWWAQRTLPANGFVIAEITPAGINHVRYDFAKERATDVEQDELEREITAGIHRSNWFVGFSIVLGLAWLVWVIKDFVGEFSLTTGSIKTVLFISMLITGYVYKAKRTKVFVGYVLAPEAQAKLEAIRRAFDALRRCGGIWAFQVQANWNDKQWKYNAGSDFSVSKLPIAIFNRAIPNLETNIHVCGVAFNQLALYFLPEKLLVIDGQDVRYIPYGQLSFAQDSLEYVETSGQVFPDSVVLSHHWLRVNRDGSPDRRFKFNCQVPKVRCGILSIDMAGQAMRLLMTNPAAPETFRRTLPKLNGLTR
jgi:hypothetical protein